MSNREFKEILQERRHTCEYPRRDTPMLLAALEKMEAIKKELQDTSKLSLFKRQAD